MRFCLNQTIQRFPQTTLTPQTPLKRIPPILYNFQVAVLYRSNFLYRNCTKKLLLSMITALDAVRCRQNLDDDLKIISLDVSTFRTVAANEIYSSITFNPQLLFSFNQVHNFTIVLFDCWIVLVDYLRKIYKQNKNLHNCM